MERMKDAVESAAGTPSAMNLTESGGPSDPAHTSPVRFCLSSSLVDMLYFFRLILLSLVMKLLAAFVVSMSNLEKLLFPKR